MSAFAAPSLLDMPAHLHPTIELRDYQHEAIAAVEKSWDEGTERPLVQLATGLGKTIVFSELAKRNLPALVIAHRDELLDQAAAKYRMIDPGASVGKVAAKSNQLYTEVVVASIQTLSRPNRLSQIVPGHFRLIVIDEAHHAPADSYRAVMNGLAHPNTRMLGVTATPERGNGGGLEGVWHELVYEMDMLSGIRRRYLSDIKGLQVRLKRADLSKLRMNRITRDFRDSDAGQMMHDAGAPEYAVKAYHEHAPGRKTIVFTPTVALAHEMAQVFRAAGVAAEAIDGSIEKAERAGVLGRFKSGETKVVCNCAVLTEGFDEPSVDCIIIARPTLSKVLYAQMIGRGTRLYPGKENCVVVDLVGVTDTLNLITVPNLFGVNSADTRDYGLLASVDGGSTPSTRMGSLGVEGAEIAATSIDLFTGRKFNWIEAAGTFVLSTEKGHVVLVPGADGWSIEHRVRGEDAEVVGDGYDLGYAQGVGEDYVRKAGASWLNKTSAGWRSKPWSQRQRDALAKWGKRFPDGHVMTAGEASDLMTSTIASRTSGKV